MFVDKVYEIEKKIDRFGIHKLSVLYWYFARILLNIFCMHKYKNQKIFKNHRRKDFTEKKVIISLTSFPARISKLWMVLETLFNQSVSADEIQLWLADSQFLNKNQINASFSKYIKAGLIIRYCDDIRAHKKYYYSMKENPDTIIVTVDDDIIYPSFMLESLLKHYKSNPDCVICNRAHLMKAKEGKLLPYVDWETRSKQSRIKKSLFLCPTGCGGVLYPPHLLPNQVFDKNVLVEKCLYADDLWLKCMEYMNGIEIVLTDIDYPEIIDIIGDNKVGLAKTNVLENRNDSQVEALTKHYHIIWK